MTIVGKIIILYFSEVVESLVQHSIKQDGSILNTGMTAIGYGRDPNLSNSKQNIAKTTIGILTKLQDVIMTDMQLKQHLVYEMELFQKKIIEACKQYDYPDTTYCQKIKEALNLLDDMFAKFRDFGLIDLTFSDNDPLSIVLFYTGLYLAAKEIADPDKSILAKAKADPRIGNGTLLAEKRENLLKNTMLHIIDDIRALDSNLPDYHDHRTRKIREQLDILQNVNEHLSKDKRFSMAISLPIEFTILLSASFLGKLRPSEGSLKAFMQKPLELFREIAPENRVVVVNPVKTQIIPMTRSPVLVPSAPSSNTISVPRTSYVSISNLFSPPKSMEPSKVALAETAIKSSLAGLLISMPDKNFVAMCSFPGQYPSQDNPLNSINFFAYTNQEKTESDEISGLIFQ